MEALFQISIYLQIIPVILINSVEIYKMLHFGFKNEKRKSNIFIKINIENSQAYKHFNLNLHSYSEKRSRNTSPIYPLVHKIRVMYFLFNGPIIYVINETLSFLVINMTYTTS